MPHVAASHAERRRYPRARFAWRAAYGLKDAEELVDARTVDVSLGGVCLRGPLVASPGDQMLVLLSMKDRVAPAIATVVRTEVIGQHEAKVQLQFNWFSDFARARLINLTRAAGQV
jgi:hypothetical protein